ncbi:GNAT family N-acetyltransferase [Ornithinimicrobium avium]|uniref:N-acetyltransferase n=1 Tax=Ornithinimicrobium avium TaxID=2283195 RepID=A0A345NMT0_9MICO|nr:GNAT family N-acetyltransferase [Ornithinimicrobium avium]AXH96338.1 N-acetyltransferase [Ornithinimicrobium avium]
MTNVAVVHHPAESRFIAMSGEDEVGRLDYTLNGGTVDLHHTEVDTAMRHQGIAGRLAEEALREIRAQKLHVRPSCPFVRAYIDRNEEHQSLLEPSLVPEDEGP